MWNLVIEGSQAQLIVQGLGLAKLMESLEVKEKKKMTDHSTLFPGGNGHVLTNSDFIKAMEDQWQMQVDEEEGWRQRQAARPEMREEKGKLNDQSQQIKQVHQRAWTMGMWNVSYSKLESQRRNSQVVQVVQMTSEIDNCFSGNIEPRC